ncbi:filamentous hemagglutinin N-terminal domain-containing protein [Sphingomonas sp. CARO-RG-8B-R24-01]|uniref:two-partner secretion domain-containing protein n=1 Tax=Sphingomonas sp. CARO-RG-8B-R24-01 TaxID=2914831 RepID=UPI002412E13C|nr:filamentous hemagglutinin N-terminal domain-containing protein [Sphingomonas sp. CARO-RG-8B-R24-01]
MTTIGHVFTPRPHRKALLETTGLPGLMRIALIGILASVGMGGQAYAQAQPLPTGGSVTAGSANIATGANSVTVTQSSHAAALNWQSFDIAAGNSVNFVQPDSNSVALNRVVGPDPSQILGNLNANGKVFLVNPNGVVFGAGSQVNVGGLVASTLNIADADFMAGKYKFSGSGTGSVLNQGTITAADGGYVALLGGRVANDGTISARLGTVALAGGEAITLDVAGDGLLNVVVDAGTVGALVRNGGLIRANGGTVLMTTQGAGTLLGTVVNNSGVVEARTIDTRGGTIKLLGDMQNGTVNLAGSLDASAPDGGNGGFVETSAASVTISDAAHVSTLSPAGATGLWLIDPQDFIIGAGGNISGATLSAMLVTNSVTISTLPTGTVTTPGTPPTTAIGTTAPGNGDIIVNDAVAWTATPSTTTLRLNADRDVVFNNSVSATNGNIVACCGRDVVVNAALTTTNGSILLNAGRNVNVLAAITTTDGNIALCAGVDAFIAASVTLTRGSTIPAQSLGLQPGLLIIAGASGTGPGVGGGTLTFAPGTAPVTVTGPNAAVMINYNPVSYSAPTDYSGFFTLSLGATVAQRMLVFPGSTKVADGTTTASLAGFNGTTVTGLPAGVTLVAGADASATYDTASAGTNIGITFSGYSLAGANAGQYALAGSCCVSTFRTSGTITPAAVVTPPVVTPPVVTPPVTTPVDTPPVVTTPVVTTPVGSTPVVTTPVVVVITPGDTSGTPPVTIVPVGSTAGPPTAPPVVLQPVPVPERPYRPSPPPVIIVTPPPPGLQTLLPPPPVQPVPPVQPMVPAYQAPQPHPARVLPAKQARN